MQTLLGHTWWSSWSNCGWVADEAIFPSQHVLSFSTIEEQPVLSVSTVVCSTNTYSNRIILTSTCKLVHIFDGERSQVMGECYHTERWLDTESRLRQRLYYHCFTCSNCWVKSDMYMVNVHGIQERLHSLNKSEVDLNPANIQELRLHCTEHLVFLIRVLPNKLYWRGVNVKYDMQAKRFVFKVEGVCLLYIQGLVDVFGKLSWWKK